VAVIGVFVRSRDLAAYAASVPTSCRRPGYFLLLAQEKVTKEKGPPESAPIGQSPIGSRTGYGLFDGASCPDEKCLASCQAPLRGLISTRPPPYTGPGRSRARADGSCRCAAHRVVAGAQRLRWIPSKISEAMPAPSPSSPRKRGSSVF